MAGAGGPPAYAEGATAMGREARRTQPDPIFALGFLAAEGAAGRYFEPPRALAAPAGSLEDLLRRSGHALGILDLRRPGAGGEWLRERLLAAPLGYVLMRADWSLNLDAFFFIRTMTPSTRAADGTRGR